MRITKHEKASITLIIDSFGSGGIQRVYRVLIGEYKRKFDHVNLVILQATLNEISISSSHKISIYRLNAKKFFDLTAFFHFKTIYKNLNSDYYIVSIYRAQIWAALIKKSNSKLIWVEHNTYYSRSRLQWIIMKLLSLRVDKIVAVSRDVKIFSEKKLGRSISVVPNPSTFVKSKSLKIKRPNHFVFIGRLVEQKNPTLLLHSFAKFLDLFDVNSFLHIIGDGPLLSRLQILTKTLEIDNKCFFYGALAPKKVEEILLKSRTLVSTSVIEGMPLVRLEAFATGCCVVTTNTGGTHFFSSLRDKGLFVSKSDQLDIANKMYRSLSQNYWTRQQVQSRMNIIQKFNPTKISEKLIQ